MCINPLIKKENIFGDNIAEASLYDFSLGNLNEENRITNITMVASICYQSPKAIGSESLYKRLESEAGGLPSSSFEFIPVLLTWGEVMEACSLLETPIKTYDNDGNIIDSKIDTQTLEIEKYGQWIEVGERKYLLTNFRAITYDFEKYGNRGIDLRKRYNTEFECSIIKQYYKVFRFKVDFPTRSQMVRHRVNFQELSRRYVSGKRVIFQHYISDKMKNVKSKTIINRPFREAPVDHNDDLTGFAGAPVAVLCEQFELSVTTQEVIEICMNHYYQALEDGVKPQEARRIIPQTGYTEFWMGFLPFQLENYFRLRDDEHAQWEIRQTAIAMKEMLVEVM